MRPQAKPWLSKPPLSDPLATSDPLGACSETFCFAVSKLRYGSPVKSTDQIKVVVRAAFGRLTEQLSNAGPIIVVQFPMLHKASVRSILGEKETGPSYSHFYFLLSCSTLVFFHVSCFVCSFFHLLPILCPGLLLLIFLRVEPHHAAELG